MSETAEFVAGSLPHYPNRMVVDGERIVSEAGAGHMDTSQEPALLAEVERFLTTTGTSASRLGREVMRDPSFVEELRRGRSVRRKTYAKVRAYLSANQPRAGEQTSV